MLTGLDFSKRPWQLESIVFLEDANFPLSSVKRIPVKPHRSNIRRPNFVTTWIYRPLLLHCEYHVGPAILFNLKYTHRGKQYKTKSD